MPGSGRSPGEGNGNPLQHSCLENSMDRRAWWATYSPQGRKELDMSERLTLSISSHWTEVDPTYKQEKREENGIREGDVVKEPEWCGAMSRGMWAASSFLPSVAQYSVWLFVTPWTIAHQGGLLCPWDFPGKNTGVGCHFLLQGTFPT